MKQQRRTICHAYAFTLLEVLVSIALTALVLALAVPLVKQVRDPAPVEAPQWMSIMGNDAATAVSREKTDVAPIRIIPPDNALAFPKLIIQTYARDGANPRGPAEVIYAIENTQNGTLELVRYARGWHDSYHSRRVIAAQVSAWNITWGTTARSPSSMDGVPSTLSSEAVTLEQTVMTVTLDTPSGTQSQSFWVPNLSVPAATNAAVSKVLP